MPTLRAATAADTAAAGVICYEAFKTIAERHNFAPDFPDPETAMGLMEHLVSREDIYGVVAEAAGRVVGSNFLWEDGVVAGVGPITIDPAAQNNGLGRRLMEAVIERARERGIPSVRLLQAAYHNRSMSLYTKLGFEAREPLSIMQGPALGLRMEGYAVRTARAADIEAADALCRRVHGHARSGELSAATAQGTAMVVERQGRVTGYTTGIGFFGHAVAETVEDLQALIGAAPSFPGPGFMVPTRNSGLVRWCLARGLRIVQPMTLMTMGPYQEPQGAYLPSILY
ncbi:GNAT family N-acetyltransferase [Dongia deserti]|uniref:GNAT family N-acetyltransferase n=1 Tax=Dongia deserti TaxID=2268030 RepID=UPI000E648A51|nr:GNAT family N-acetyltransferase [Dongia deserti]